MLPSHTVSIHVSVSDCTLQLTYFRRECQAFSRKKKQNFLTVLLDIYERRMKSSKRGKQVLLQKEDIENMKGYFVDGGYMGYVDGAYMLFADEEDYFEYVEEM